MRLPLHRFLCRWLVCSWLGHRADREMKSEHLGSVHRTTFCNACGRAFDQSVDTLGDARCASGEEVVRR